MNIGMKTLFCLDILWVYFVDFSKWIIKTYSGSVEALSHVFPFPLKARTGTQPTLDILSATYCTCYPASSLHLIIPLFIVTASHPSASEKGPIYTEQRWEVAIKSTERGGDGSSSSGTVYRPGEFLRVSFPVTWRDPGLDPNSERRDLWRDNTPTFDKSPHSQLRAKSVGEEREVDRQPHKDGKGKGREGRREIKIYVDLGWVRVGREWVDIFQSECLAV